MRVYTRTGDGGETGLRGGARVSKTDLRVVVCGELDELNAALGLAAALTDDAVLLSAVRKSQSRVFDVGADVASLGTNAESLRLEQTWIEDIEATIDHLEANLLPLNTFILPGGCPAAAALHLARAVCRRAERSLVDLAEHSPAALPYVALLNRMSDLLFVLARSANARSGLPDIPWSGGGGACRDA